MAASASGSFRVDSPEAYAGPFPKFTQPKEVAYFSRDGQRSVSFDKTALRTFTAPQLPVILNDGFEQYVPKDNSGEPAPLKDVLAALSHHQCSPAGRIVTYRNNMNKLMLTPYSLKDDWEMEVEKREDGTVLLHVRDTERKAAEEARRDEMQQRMCYWGYRFEQLCTGARSDAAGSASADGGEDGEDACAVTSPSRPTCFGSLGYPPHELTELKKRYGHGTQQQSQRVPSGGGVVNANEEFCTVMSITIGSLRILMAAEIDCADGGSHGKYVELKTNKLLQSERDTNSFERHKLLKFWLQSFLAGVPKIIVGFRDSQGVVRQLQPLETLQIPRMVREKKVWDPSSCVNFGKRVLEWMMGHLSASPGARRFLLRYEPSRREISLQQIPARSSGPLQMGFDSDA